MEMALSASGNSNALSYPNYVQLELTSVKPPTEERLLETWDTFCKAHFLERNSSIEGMAT